MNCFSEILKNSVKINKKFISIFIVSCIISIINILRSFYIGRIIQNLKYKDLIILIILVFFSYFFIITSKILTNKEIVSYNNSFFNNFLKKLFSGNFKYIINQNEYILSELNDSLLNINYITNTIYFKYINQIFIISLTIIILFYYSPYTAIAMILSIFCIYLFCSYLFIILEDKWNKYWNEYILFNKKFQNVMLNIWNIKYNSMENYIEKYLKNSFKKRMNKMKKWINTKIIMQEVPDSFLFIVVVTNLYIIIKYKNIPVSIRVFLVLLLFRIWQEIYGLCISVTDLYQQKKNIEKVCPIWLLEQKKHKNIKIDKIKNIEFKDINYSYDKKTVLRNVNFKIKENEIVVLGGESGKGKSTIISLICRLYDTKSNGQINFNGINIKDIELESLRNKISVVPQKIFVFNETIENNIIMGGSNSEKGSFSNVDELIKILSLPDKKTNATKLSYGQKQRVLIGRSLYQKQKSVYIFDEYLSAVDYTTAMRIHKYVIDFLKKNKKIGIFIYHNNNLNYGIDRKIYF